MGMSSFKLKLTSYNCHGALYARKTYISELCGSHDIVFLQEHWLLESQIDDLRSVSDCINIHAKSGVDSNGSVLKGRPYGGCAFLWNMQIDKFITCVDSKSKRICAVMFDDGIYKMLLMSVYLPCDNYNVNFASEEYIQTIGEVSRLVHLHNAQYIICAGDFNTDFSRNNSHAQYLSSFLQGESLKRVTESNNCDNIDYTYHNHNYSCLSVIDHIFVSENLLDTIRNAGVLHSGDNFSDHDPVFVELELEVNQSIPEVNNYT